MKLTGRIYSYFLILLICSTIITIAGIYGFQRLEPSMNILNNSNTRSLFYAEQMLISISSKNNIKPFEDYLNLAKNNITEPGERETVEKIENNYKKAFEGDTESKEETINDISSLAAINRTAMEHAVIKEKRMQTIGIWIIIFPSIFIWIIGITLLKRLDRVFIKPIQELNNVILEYNKGNLMRRCPSITTSKEIQKLYDGINNILDNK